MQQLKTPIIKTTLTDSLWSLLIAHTNMCANKNNKTKVARHKNKNQFVMYPCLENRFIVFVKGYFFLWRDISFVLRTHEISLHKNNSLGSPDKDTALTGSCYNIVRSYRYLIVVTNTATRRTCKAKSIDVLKYKNITKKYK